MQRAAQWEFRHGHRGGCRAVSPEVAPDPSHIAASRRHMTAIPLPVNTPRLTWLPPRQLGGRGSQCEGSPSR
jgi:hypothetical protein